jgi:hypothetical protein
LKFGFFHFSKQTAGSPLDIERANGKLSPFFSEHETRLGKEYVF